MNLPAAALILLTLLATLSRARSDALVLTQAMKADTIAEIFVEETEIRVDLEIGMGNLSAFQNILPDEIHAKLGTDSTPWRERLPLFTEDFLVKADGELLEGRVLEMEGRTRVTRDEITGDPLPSGPDAEGEVVLAVSLLFPLSGEPKLLSFTPPTSGDSNRVSANIGFITYHRGVPVNDFRYLGRTEILYLDWEDPWYSKFRNPNLRRQFSAPIKGFLYVEPYEVRKEIVVRPLDLEHWIDLGLKGKDVIAAQEQEAIKTAVAEFLKTRCPVKIDGQPVDMALDRVHFIRRTLRTTSVVDPPEDLPALSAILGVIFVARTEGYPQEVTMDWDLFTPRTDSMFGTTTDEAGSLPQQVAPDYPTLKWTNYLKNPTLPSFVELKPPPAPPNLSLPLGSMACALLLLVPLRAFRVQRWNTSNATKLLGILSFLGIFFLWPFARVEVPLPFAASRKVSDQEAGELVAGLLKNTYRAFDYRDESAIYDTLERSVTGDLLTEVYLDIREALELQNQGGARAKVSDIEMIEVTQQPLEGGPAFQSRCTWTVTGSVGHWGHTHQRRNQYQADIIVEPEAGSWKFTSLELLEEKRL